MLTRRLFLKSVAVAGLAISGFPHLNTIGQFIDKINGKLSCEDTLNNNKYMFVNTHGVTAFKPVYVPGIYFEDGLVPVKIGKTEGGYYNKSGEITLRAQCGGIHPFSEGLAFVIDWAIIHSNSHAIIKPETGFIDISGTMVIKKSRYEKNGSVVDLWPEYSEGMLSIGINNKYGYIDRTGDIVIEPKFCYAHDFHDGLAVVRVGKKDGYINRAGEVVIEPRFAVAFDFTDGCAFVYTDEHNMLCINKQGKTVLDLDMNIEEYMSCVQGPSDGLFYAEIKDRGCFYNNEGHIVLEPAYEVERPYFSEGLVPAAVDNKWGYMNKLGQMVIPPQYDSANDFSEGFAAVRVKDRYGFINKQTDMVCDPRFYRAFRFSEGLSLVKLVPDSCRRLLC